MKHIYILVFAILLALSSTAQTLIVKWTFPSGTSVDSIADGGIAANSTRALRAIGTSAIDFTKNGFTNKAAQTTCWDNGSGTKCWQVSFTTIGYAGFKLSSRQQSGGNNPGPRDFRLQFKIGDNGTWTDISGGTILTANDWTTAYVNNIALPSECDGQNLIYVRWLMNSNVPSSGSGDVLAAGISKIDDIVVTADINTGLAEANSDAGISLFPNPVTNNLLNIQSDQKHLVIYVFDLQGKLVKTVSTGNGQVILETSNFPKGMYLAHILSRGGMAPRKFIVE